MSVKKRAPKTEEEPVKPQERTLLLQMGDGTETKIELPPGSRVTFGPTIPYQRKNGYVEQQTGYSLRVYSGKGQDTLIAVFGGVAGFRDISIPCWKQVMKEAGKRIWKSDEQGYKVEDEVKHEKSWVDASHQIGVGEDR